MTESYLVSLRHLTDDFPGCRVDGGEGFPTGCILPLVVDEQLNETSECEQMIGFTKTTQTQTADSTFKSAAPSSGLSWTYCVFILQSYDQ